MVLLNVAVRLTSATARWIGISIPLALPRGLSADCTQCIFISEASADKIPALVLRVEPSARVGERRPHAFSRSFHPIDRELFAQLPKSTLYQMLTGKSDGRFSKSTIRLLRMGLRSRDQTPAR